MGQGSAVTQVARAPMRADWGDRVKNGSGRSEIKSTALGVLHGVGVAGQPVSAEGNPPEGVCVFLFFLCLPNSGNVCTEPAPHLTQFLFQARRAFAGTVQLVVTEGRFFFISKKLLAFMGSKPVISPYLWVLYPTGLNELAHGNDGEAGESTRNPRVKNSLSNTEEKSLRSSHLALGQPLALASVDPEPLDGLLGLRGGHKAPGAWKPQESLQTKYHKGQMLSVTGQSVV